MKQMDLNPSIAKIKKRFQMLQTFTEGAINGTIRGLVVSGAPGIGKSYGIEKALKGMEPVQSDDPLEFNFNFGGNYRFVKGHMTAAGLYELLYEFSQEGDVLAIDDCDSIFNDEIGLNILKAALDTNSTRTLSWQSLGTNIKAPKRFDFNGSIIFITNLNFKQIIQDDRSKLVPHLDAIIDRCYYLDMGLRSFEEKIMWIEEVALNQGMITGRGFTPSEAVEIFSFVRDSGYEKISLRKILQVSDVFRTSSNWKFMATETVLS